MITLDLRNVLAEKLPKKNSNCIIITHLNISSIRNKTEMLKEVLGNKIDVLLISETKLDDTFPVSQLVLEGFTQPCRLDKAKQGGGLRLLVRKDIPTKLLHNAILMVIQRTSLSKSI